MRFVILGAGAIGCYVGGRLAANGRQVSLVGRPRIVLSLQRTGLGVSDCYGFSARVAPQTLHMATSLAAVALQPEDVVLLCVKGGATESAALEIGACCPPGTTVVSLQNGVDNVARIRAIAPRMRALAGMVACNVVMPAADRVHQASAGGLYMTRNSTTSEMALLLGASGLETILVDDMLPVQWGKLLLNLNNPVNALSDLPLRSQLMDRDYRRVLAALQAEALAVMRMAGIRPARVGAVPPRLLPLVLRLPDWLFGMLAAPLLRMDPLARSSMWDDVQRGRSTEVDDLCGAVVRLATQHGTRAPRNAAMCSLVQQHRKGGRLSAAAMRSAALL